MSAARRQGCRLLVAVGVVAMSMVGGAGAANADAAFTITTSAEGIATTVSNTSFPIVQSAEANAPTAQSTLNSRQFGTSYSSAPDPGLTVAELPTTTAGELCGEAMNPPGCPTVAAAIPAYPYAYAQTGDQPQSQNAGAVSLYAAATTISSDAVTTISGATSTTHTIANADDSVDGTAVSDVTSLQATTAVMLSSVHASATVHRDPAGAITTTSTFDVGDIDIAGTQVGFMNGQFVAMGVGLPVPVDPNTVLKALAASGVTATYLPATTTTTGVVSAGLQLQYALPGSPVAVNLPSIPGSPVDVGVPTTPTMVTETLGLVSANATYKLIPSGTDSDTGGSVTGGATSSTTTPDSSTTPSVTSPGTTTPTGKTTTPVTTPVTTTPVTPVSTAAGGAATDGSGSVSPAASGTTLAGPASGDVLTPPPTVAGTTATVAPQADKKAALAGAIPLTGDSIDIYLALVAAAFLAFGGSHAIRLLGVRFRWGS